MSVAKYVLCGALAAAAGVAAFVKPWESPPTGPVLEPYRDIVGRWTWCDGITHGPRKARYTVEECNKLLEQEVAKHLRGLARCINRPLDNNEWVALGSWAFNVGTGAACGSTLVRKINAGAPASEWCRELLRWDYAGGRKVRGLTLRREAEYRECLK